MINESSYPSDAILPSRSRWMPQMLFCLYRAEAWASPHGDAEKAMTFSGASSALHTKPCIPCGLRATASAGD